jgi:hypothetical protein
MTKTQNPSEAGAEIMAAQALLGGAVQAGNPIANQLFALMARKYEKEMAIDADKDERAKKARLMGAKSMEQKRQIELLKQSQCPHQKPNRVSALVGQRDHQNNYLFICQICAAEWKGNAVPSHLRISGDDVGGPNY